jgi:aspartate/methionine/tyrosine aminotransferase
MPNFIDMGIDTSWDNFLNHEKNVEEELKEEISKLYSVKKESILITAGGTEAIFIVSAFFSAYSRRIIVTLPEYEPIFLAPMSLGMTVINKIENIKKRDSFAASLPNNPSGSLDFEDIVERYNKDHMFFLDEAFRDFLFEDPRKTLFRKYDNLIISNTMTKFYGLDNLIRVGWLISTKNYIDKMKDIKNLTTIIGSSFSYWIAIQALKNREKFIARAKKIVLENKKIFRETLENIDKIGFAINDMPFVFIKYKGMSSLKLCKIAAENYGILMSPGKFFGSENYLRVCFTSEKYQFSEDINALKKFFTENL